MAHGLDHFFTGCKQIYTGEYQNSATNELLQKTGMSHETASLVDGGLSIAGAGFCGYLQATARTSATGARTTAEITNCNAQTDLRCIKNGINQLPRSHTKSNLQLGRQMHSYYKSGIEGFKEFRLPCGRRIDFLDPKNGLLYELKPNNPRAIRQGHKQLELYLDEIKKMPRFQNIDWKAILETY